MAGQGNIKVAVRVRPFLEREKGDECCVEMSGNLTTINVPNRGMKSFSYNYCYWSVNKDVPDFVDQNKVYLDLGEDVVESAFQGYNICIFAYGQTGSGKTFTMMGGQDDDEGLIPRICKNLVREMDEREGDFRLEVSFLEIFNEKLYDLLPEAQRKSKGKKEPLKIRVDPRKGVFVQGLTKHRGDSYSSIMQLLDLGMSHRTVAETKMNSVSSRSHAVFIIQLTQKNGKTSKVNLVDLAGSERQENAATQGASLKAGISINKSLTFLRQAIEKLARASKHQERGTQTRGASKHINMRNTQLTYLLQDSLGGNSKTTMVAAISPSVHHANESLRTLEFALCASTVTTKFTVNEDPTKRQLTSLLAEIEQLKQQLKEQDSEELQKSLASKEEQIVALKKEWDDKWGVVHHIFESSQLKLEAEKNGMILDTALPHLVTLNASRLDTGISINFIPNQGRLEFGTVSHDNPPDVVLHGPRVQKLHCTVVMNNGDVFLVPHSEACYVGNKQIFTKTHLAHGCAVVLGEVNMFRFNNPAEALELQQSADMDPIDATPLSGPLSYLELDFTKEKAALEARLETLQSKISSLEKDVKENPGHSAAPPLDHRASSSELEDLARKFHWEREMFERANETLNELTTMLSHLQKEKELHNELETGIETDVKLIADDDSSSSDSESEQKQMKKKIKNSSHQQRAEKLESEITALQNQLKEAHDEVEEFRARYAQAEGVYKSEKLRAVLEERKKVEEQLVAVEDRKADADKEHVRQVKQLEEKISELVKLLDLERKKVQSAVANSRVDSIVSKMRQRAQVQKLERKLTETQDKLKSGIQEAKYLQNAEEKLLAQVKDVREKTLVEAKQTTDRELALERERLQADHHKEMQEAHAKIAAALEEQQRLREMNEQLRDQLRKSIDVTMLVTTSEETEADNDTQGVEDVNLSDLLVSVDCHAEEEVMCKQAMAAAEGALAKLEDQSRALLKHTAKNTEKKSEWLAKRMEDERVKLESYASRNEAARDNLKTANDKLESAKKAEIRRTRQLKKQQILLMKPEVKRLLDDSSGQFYSQLLALVDEHGVSLAQIYLDSVINDHAARKCNDYRSKVAQFQQRLLQQNEQIRSLQDEKRSYIDYAERMLHKSTTHAKALKDDKLDEQIRLEKEKAVLERRADRLQVEKEVLERDGKQLSQEKETETVDLQKQLEEIKNQLDSQKDNSAYRQSPADQVDQLKVDRASAAVQQFDAIERFFNRLSDDSESSGNSSKESYQNLKEEWETALHDLTMAKIDADGQKRRADRAEFELDEERHGRQKERSKDLEMMEKLQKLMVGKDEVLNEKEKMVIRLEEELQQLRKKDATTSAACAIL